jgi:hypothetical protein
MTLALHDIWAIISNMLSSVSVNAASKNSASNSQKDISDLKVRIYLSSYFIIYFSQIHPIRQNLRVSKMMSLHLVNLL